ncbi:MAG: dihydropteroate synthase [Planctomycetes bacterium]|nr:dihydropteroate synthase [Planctomycetota bacterium]
MRRPEPMSTGPVSCVSPTILGVVNATPDSFSDGGAFLDPERAIEHGVRLVEDGADLLDVGGESTRPGSEPVTEAEELARVLPVVRGLARRTRVPISIDTTKARVAEEALAAGASIVNDVSAGRIEPRILAVAARARAGYVLMHMLGTPRDMQRDPRYGDVVTEVRAFLAERVEAAVAAGIERSKLWIDPGIGFGKTLEHNLELLRRLGELHELGLPILLGVSRKAFIAGVEEQAGRRRSPAGERLGGTLAALAIGIVNGASILRVHDVREAKQAALVARALAPGSAPSGSS